MPECLKKIVASPVSKAKACRRRGFQDRDRTRWKHLRVNIFTARPGIVIGKKGSDIENLRKDIEQMTDRKAFINVMEIKRPNSMRPW